MNKKFLFLGLINIFQNVNSKSDVIVKPLFKKKLKKNKKNFISIPSDKEVIKDFYKSITFKTLNGLTITYFGLRYNFEYLKDYLGYCQNAREAFVKLSALGFDDIKFIGDVLEIRDPFKIESVNFHVTYVDENQIKVKKYDQHSKPLFSYYSQYLSVSRLDLKNQEISPITLKEIKASLQRLKLHFIRLGYIYADIGYNLIQNEKTRKLNIVFNIDLGELKPNTIKLIGGDSTLNNILKNKCPRYLPSIFEVSSNYLFISDFVRIIQNQYYSSGYFDLDVESYFDDYKKEMVYIINANQRFKVDDYQIDVSNSNIIISDQQKQQIERIVEKDSVFYSERKKRSVERLLSSLYHKDEYFLEYLLKKDYENKCVSMVFSFKRKALNPHKLLTSIKCIGNSKISSTRVVAYLGKKIGDMISEDDICSLKSSLYKSQCFSFVDLLLEDLDDSYGLVISLKEGPLFKMGDLSFNIHPSIAGQFSGEKRNIFDSGINVGGCLSVAVSENSSKNGYVDLRLNFDNFFPNGQKSSFGLFFQYYGDCDKINPLKTSRAPYTDKLFDQDGGGKYGVFFSTPFLDYDHVFELSWRHFRQENKGFPFLSLKTDVVNKRILNYDNSLTELILNNELIWGLSSLNYKKPHDRIEFICMHYIPVQNTKFNIRLHGQLGVLLDSFFHEKDEYTKYYKFQQLRFLNLGSWGPKEGGFTVGGDSKVGAGFRLSYDLNFEFLPSFLNGTFVFGQIEGGSIFDFKDRKLVDNFVSGSSLGIEIPFLGGQINIVVYYFIPLLQNVKDDNLIQKGWNIGLEMSLGKIFTD